MTSINAICHKPVMVHCYVACLNALEALLGLAYSEIEKYVYTLLHSAIL